MNPVNRCKKIGVKNIRGGLALLLALMLVFSAWAWDMPAAKAEESVSTEEPATTPEPTAEPTPEPTAEPTPEPTPIPTLEATPAPTPTAEPAPAPTSDPAPETEGMMGTLDFEQFAQGDGSECDPYGISTPEQLNAVRDYPDAHFIMLTDIDMSEATSEGGIYWNDGAGWEPIGDSNVPFSGVFDGGGYKIIGLYQTITTNTYYSTYSGLFSNIKNGTISNLGLQEGTIIIKNQINCDVGGIAGSAVDSLIDNCFNANRIIGGASTGGIVGRATDSIVRGCYNAGRISSRQVGYAGGIVGSMWPSYIENCYNAASISGGNRAGGIVGDIEFLLSGCGVKNCYNVGSVSSVNAGGISGYARNGYISNCFYLNILLKGVGEGSDQTICLSKAQMSLEITFDDFDFGPVWTMEGHEEYPYPELQAWEMVVQPVSSYFAGGSGVSYDPYQIADAEQFDQNS